MVNKKKIMLIFILIVSLQIVNLVFWGWQKPNFFGDEIWSFNFANSSFFPLMNDAASYQNKWLDNNFWLQAFTVQDTERFNYSSVFYNMTFDNHPPVYFLILHTICSFFPNTLDKWFGIIPNIFFFVFTQIVLVLLSKELIRPFNYHVLMPALIYGFTWGLINDVILCRPYMLVILWALLAFYLHVLLYRHIEGNNENKERLGLWVGLSLTVILGILTHFYFLIYETLLSLCFGLHLWNQGKLAGLRKYLLTLGVAAIASIAIFPCWPSRVLGGGICVPATAFTNLLKFDLYLRIKAFIKLLNIDLAGGLLPVIFIMALFLLLTKLTGMFIKLHVTRIGAGYGLDINFHNPKSNYHLELEPLFNVWLWGIIVCGGYFIIVAKIAPYYESRYMAMLFPLLILLGFMVFRFLLSRCFESSNICLVMVGIFVVLSALLVYRIENIRFIDKQMPIVKNLVTSKYKDSALISINKGVSWWPEIRNGELYLNINRSYLAKYDNLTALHDDLHDYLGKHDDLLIIVAHESKDQETNIVNDILEHTNYIPKEKYNLSGDSLYILGR
jgi:hypothetical protein